MLGIRHRAFVLADAVGSPPYGCQAHRGTRYGTPGELTALCGLEAVADTGKEWPTSAGPHCAGCKQITDSQ